MNVLSNFAHRHHPVVYALLLLIDFGLCFNLSEERLEAVDHVTVECYAYHFYTNGEEEFVFCVTFDITIPNTCECCDYPIDCCDVVASIIQLLHIIHVVLENPSIIIIKKLSITNEHPLASKEVTD
jgi:hypothetical protein